MRLILKLNIGLLKMKELRRIRIIQKDVFKDKYDWLVELCDNIEKITNEHIVQNIYMCKND